MAVSVGRVSAESLFQFKGLQNWSQTSAENRLRAASLELNAYIYALLSATYVHGYGERRPVHEFWNQFRDSQVIFRERESETAVQEIPELQST